MSLLSRALERASNFTPSEAAAWYGALLASVSFLWQIYNKMRSGPRLQGSVSPNMKFMTTGAHRDDHDDQLQILVSVFNVGDRATTITHLTFEHCANVWQRLRWKPSYGGFVPTPSPSQPIPHVIEPGKRWMGTALQNGDLEERLRRGYLYAVVYYDGAKQLRMRVRPKKLPESELAANTDDPKKKKGNQ